MARTRTSLEEEDEKSAHCVSFVSIVFGASVSPALPSSSTASLGRKCIRSIRGINTLPLARLRTSVVHNTTKKIVLGMKPVVRSKRNFFRFLG